MKYRIVYVEDNPINATIMKLAIENQGFGFRHFSCAETFLKKGKLSEYDLIITDYMMPIMNGLELSEIIKKDSPNLPIVLCSAVHSSELKLNVKNIDAYLSKPFKIETLKAILKQLLLNK